MVNKAEFKAELNNQEIPTINSEEQELLERLSYKLYKQRQQPHKYKYFYNLSEKKIDLLETQTACLLFVNLKSAIILNTMLLYNVFIQQVTKRFEAAVGISFFVGLLLGIFLGSH